MNNIIVKKFIKSALKEDIGRGDLFEYLAPKIKYKAKIISKSDGILSGMIYIRVLAKYLKFKIKILKDDGDHIKQGDTILIIKAKAQTLLSAERTILDILQHSSGIATNVNEYVQLFNNSNIKILDTRKTRPLLREFEKYSVLNGGGVNHRKGLDDSLMLKDTHLKTIDNLKLFMQDARAKIPWTSKIEIECEDLDMAKNAMQYGADIVMCDNMNIEDIKSVLKYRDNNFKHILIEVSGNITKAKIPQLIKLNIDAISSGSMIHQATWLDFSMKIS